MKKKPSPKTILAKNPHVDAARVRETCAAIKQLRRMGVKGAEYNLVAPFSRRLSSASTACSPRWQSR